MTGYDEQYMILLQQLEEREPKELSDGDITGILIQKVLCEIAGSLGVFTDLAVRDMLRAAFDGIWETSFQLSIPGPWNHPDEPGHATHPNIADFLYSGDVSELIDADDES